MEGLLKKKSSTRESALKVLVEKFENNFHYDFAKNNFVTLIYHCQKCLEKGSDLEIQLALQLMGLIVLTLGEGDESHEIFEDSLVFLPKLLVKSKSSIKVIECLSVITLVGAKDFIDTERSMEIIWQFMSSQESSSKETKRPSAVTAASISSWSFLLSSIDKWRICPKKWKGLIPYLLNQLEEDDDEYIIASSIGALALIFENGSLEKFSNQAGEYATIKDLKDDIVKQVKTACSGTNEDTVKILEDDYNKTTTHNLCGTRLCFSTWSQLKQLNYIRRFLGFGFTNHMIENEYLHKVFDFVPARKHSGLELYTPEFEEVVVGIFFDDVRRKSCNKRIHMSPCSMLNKGRTKLMNKYRSLADEAKAGVCIADEELY